MTKVVYAKNVSLDGFVDHDRFAPDEALFAHWTEQVGSASAGLYGRRIYQLMQYWDVDGEDWSEAHREFARHWRAQRKFVASRRPLELGPGASQIPPDLKAFVRDLKERSSGEISVSGTDLAAHLTDLGLIDEYRLYLHPVVLGSGVPFFKAPPPRPLELIDSQSFGRSVVRLSYRISV